MTDELARPGSSHAMGAARRGVESADGRPDEVSDF